MVSLVHFKNSVHRGVTALLNGRFVKTEKVVKQWFRACIGLLELLVLSGRSLVDHFGACQPYPRTQCRTVRPWVGYGYPGGGWWVMVVGGGNGVQGNGTGKRPY